MRKQLKQIKGAVQAKQYRRKLSIRSKISGTSERPRVCAIKTNNHLMVQVIDDTVSKTIFSAQTFGKAKVEGASKSVDGAKKLGTAVAKGLKGKGIASIVFDRNGKKYTGTLAALADSIREGGIKF